jgi:DNA repair exonuclease SbcCD ATPase subunit
MRAYTNKPDDSQDAESVRARLERALAEKDALLNDLRRVAVERDRIREEADNRSSFWRRRFHVTGVVVLLLAVLTALVAWLVSSRIDRVTHDVSDVKRSVAALEETSTTAIERPEDTSFDSERELSNLRREAEALRKQVRSLRSTVSSLKKVDEMRTSSRGDVVLRLKKQHAEDLSAVREEKDAQIRKLREEVDDLEDDIGRLKKTKGIAIPVLIDALGHPDASVRLGAANALRSLTDRRFGTNQAKWLEWWKTSRANYLAE